MSTGHNTKKLKYKPRDLALELSDEEIERVIVEFVEVKNMRDKNKRRRV